MHFSVQYFPHLFVSFLVGVFNMFSVRDARPDKKAILKREIRDS